MSLILILSRFFAQFSTAPIHVEWDHTLQVSSTTSTLQMVVNPKLRAASPIHDSAFGTLRDFNADFVRYASWYPYPHLAIAELYPPTASHTFWDFTYMDELTADFMRATRGHSVVFSLSTLPPWMFLDAPELKYPEDPNEQSLTHIGNAGKLVRDPSFQEIADYELRLFEWYTQGGFFDEQGSWHGSGHFYEIPVWEVMNEIDLEHFWTSEEYCKLYDQVVSRIHAISPETRFMGLALSHPERSEGMAQIEYFLNPAHHASGIPLDFISYHFYAYSPKEQSMTDMSEDFFNQADAFIQSARDIEKYKNAVAPLVQTDIDELGTILSTDFDVGPKSIDPAYWNLSAAIYAYSFAKLSLLGVDVVGESQLVGYPTQFPSVSMVDWESGAPNAKSRVLKLIIDNFKPGGKWVETESSDSKLFAQGYIDQEGRKKLLLVNKSTSPISFDFEGRKVQIEALGVRVESL